jgi:pimeloyl-ACP methyl ester carboxylesterase
MFLEDKGTGSALLLLHGFCETHDVWQGIANRLSDHYRVIMPDLPGFGQSPLLPPPFTLDEVGAYVLDKLSSQGVDDCVAIGHSLGGYVALAMAALQPGRIRALALVHSTAMADSDERKENRNRVIALIRQSGAQPFIRTFFQNLFARPHPSQAWLTEQALSIGDETLIAYTQAMRDRPSRLPFLKNYPGKVLYISGRLDPLIPLDQAEKQVQELGPSRASLAVLNDSAHMGLLEAEEDTYHILEDWLRSALKNAHSG